MNKDEKIIFELVLKNKEIFQSEIAGISGFHKSKICRILKKLETMELVERKRNGFTKVVLSKF